MFNGQYVLALVPARGGSKGLPGKNIAALGGKPLIAWTVEAALASRYIDEVVVSTDCEDIASVAQNYGAQVPFLRPAELATDQASSFDALLHALNWYAERGRTVDLVVWLQPTSPLRTRNDIDSAIELYEAREARAVVSVCATDHHPWWANTLPPDANMSGFLRPEALNTNRQDLPPHYRLNGAIYLASPQYLARQGSFYGDRTFAYVMPRERSVDIDDAIDLKLANVLLESP